MLLHDRAVKLNCSHTHKSQGKVREQTRQEGGPGAGGGGGAFGACRMYKDSVNLYCLSESYGTVNMHCHDGPKEGGPTPTAIRDKISLHTSL